MSWGKDGDRVFSKSVNGYILLLARQLTEVTA